LYKHVSQRVDSSSPDFLPPHWRVFTGSLLIETFSLDGLGLQRRKVIRRDGPAGVATLYLFTLIGWLPNCQRFARSGWIRVSSLIELNVRRYLTWQLAAGRRAWRRFRVASWALISLTFFDTGGAQLPWGLVQRQAGGQLSQLTCWPVIIRNPVETLKRRIIWTRSSKHGFSRLLIKDLPAEPYGPCTINYFCQEPNLSAVQTTCSDDRNGICWLSWIYGFRLSVLFGLALTAIGVIQW
jgi:hypothetical protein